MTDIIISGICGRMGRKVLALTGEDPETRVVCGVDLKADETTGVPVFTDFSGISAQAVVIDFSSASNLGNILSFCARTGSRAVLAATGYTEEDLESVRLAAERTAIFKTANLSAGIALLEKLVREAAAFLGSGFDIEIVEKHHSRKKDAPSGTALMLADAAKAGSGEEKNYVYGREGICGPREKSEIGVHAVRGGTITGEHEVIFAGEDEIITISHSARSKTVFAAGAVRAAKFLADKGPGLYTMHDILGE